MAERWAIIPATEPWESENSNSEAKKDQVKYRELRGSSWVHRGAAAEVVDLPTPASSRRKGQKRTLTTPKQRGRNDCSGGETQPLAIDFPRPCFCVAAALLV